MTYKVVCYTYNRETIYDESEIYAFYDVFDGCKGEVIQVLHDLHNAERQLKFYPNTVIVHDCEVHGGDRFFMELVNV